MIENDNQNSQQAASAAVRNAPNLAKIAQAGVQGGPAGAAAEAAVQYRKEVLVVAIAVMLLPVLVLIMLPGAIFGTLTQPSTAVNDDLEIAANVIQLRNAVSDILQEAYEDTLAEIESERASRTYSDIDDSVGGHVSYNAFQLISMYCAYQGEDDYTKISLSNLSEQIQAHRTEYYTYTISEEVRTEPVQKEVRGQTITVQEDHTYTIFTLSYVHDSHVMASLCFVIDGNIFLAVLPPVVFRVVVGRFYLQQRNFPIWQTYKVVHICQHERILRVLEHLFDLEYFQPGFLGEYLRDQRFQQMPHFQRYPVACIIGSRSNVQLVIVQVAGGAERRNAEDCGDIAAAYPLPAVCQPFLLGEVFGADQHLGFLPYVLRHPQPLLSRWR